MVNRLTRTVRNKMSPSGVNVSAPVTFTRSSAGDAEPGSIATHGTGICEATRPSMEIVHTTVAATMPATRRRRRRAGGRGGTLTPGVDDQSGSSGGGSMSSAVSTSALDPVALIAALAALLVMVRARPGHLHLQPAMRRAHLGRTRSSTHEATWYAVAVEHDTRRPASTSSSSSRLRALAHDAFGLRPPAPAEYGNAARISPLRRVRSALLLAALLVVNGVLVAAGIGLVAFLGGFLLEQAIK